MKAFIIIVALIAVTGLAAIATNPTNGYCIDQVMKRKTNDQVEGFEGRLLSSLALHVDNKIFWKVIKVQGTDTVIGYACFGFVIC